MSKDFDLEAAKRGERICARETTGRSVLFVGATKGGRIVVEDEEGNIRSVRGYDLRMAPKATKQYRRFKHIWHSGTVLIDVLNRGIIYPDPHDLERASIFGGWIDFEWQSVEVEG